ncbi:hypothetical protein [Streptomyces sp. NPDC088358]|uniref:MmyB family transcriptional regulator n=1 Tax=Streptomyces sp. NPDC088358 TaxID=3365857 RepID=UPI00381B58AF
MASQLTDADRPAALGPCGPSAEPLWRDGPRRPAADRPRRKRPLAPQRVHPTLYQALDVIGYPAMVQGRRTDVLATNRLAAALYTDFQARPYAERNFARHLFLDEAVRTLYGDHWDKAAAEIVASLHLYAGSHSGDPQLTELIGELLSCHCATRTSAACGPTTTSWPTPPAPSTSTTRSSATSPSTTSP